MSKTCKRKLFFPPEIQNLPYTTKCSYCAKPVTTWYITMREAEETSSPHGQELREENQCSPLPCEGMLQ